MEQPIEKKYKSSSEYHPLTVIEFEEEDLKPKAEQLASDFGLKIRDKGTEPPDAILLLTQQHLELHRVRNAPASKPFRIDFTEETFQYRKLHGGARMLIKALGIKKTHPTIIDVTGGLARDSFLVASSGCPVIVYERNPVVAALLQNALSRAVQHPNTMEAAQRLQLIFTDATAALKEMSESGKNCDIIYIDPMFPQRSKSAKVKKDLQTLQFLIGQDPDTTELFEMAMSVATKRVVVKRPRKSPTLTNLKPSHTIEGSTIRFDVYLIG